MKITIREAVDLCYRGRSNMVKASQAAEVDIEILKRLLLEKVQRTPIELTIQLPLKI